ncbi:putative membrane protein YhaH [Bacillus mojavensis]|jgi:gas vesicle protein|uniref:Membrane protein YhaH n=2 Tax=Bacillus mojavensis TaxID=72360 RepID=A0ABX6LYA5_BACMO|nr:putative membrane protein YhaH [Bacillus mojavensis]
MEKSECIIFQEKNGVILMADGRSLLTGLFVGGIIGGAAVLLSAPSSGKQLREKIKTNCDSFEETIKRLKSDGVTLKDQLVKAAKESADVIKDVSGELQTSIKKWQEEIKPHQQDLQKEIADIEEKIKQLEKTLQN